MFSIPIFPLPNVVLFPNVFLPLHIFEPRYRQMVADALAGDRMIGMVLLRPGYQADYEGAPPIYPTGCSGLISHSDRLEDGRYNIVLRGIDKFTIQREEPPDADRLYRTAIVEPAGEAVAAAERSALREARRQLQDLLTPLFSGPLEGRLSESMPDEDLINALAQYLEFDPMEKLALLQRNGPLARCRAMMELLEMKRMGSGIGDQGSGLVH
jgi:Lon protease-like protein